MTPEAAVLRDYMSELSEAAYSAAWMEDLEFALWAAVERGPFQYGRLDVSDEHVARLRRLSEACGGWIRFDDELEEVFVPLSEWGARFAERATERWT